MTCAQLKLLRVERCGNYRSTLDTLFAPAMPLWQSPWHYGHMLPEVCFGSWVDQAQMALYALNVLESAPDMASITASSEALL